MYFSVFVEFWHVLEAEPQILFSSLFGDPTLQLSFTQPKPNLHSLSLHHPLCPGKSPSTSSQHKDMLLATMDLFISILVVDKSLFHSPPLSLPPLPPPPAPSRPAPPPPSLNLSSTPAFEQSASRRATAEGVALRQRRSGEDRARNATLKHDVGSNWGAPGRRRREAAADEHAAGRQRPGVLEAAALRHPEEPRRHPENPNPRPVLPK